jgi:thiosulfate dehydrogenase [quinone] large subunit
MSIREQAVLTEDMQLRDHSASETAPAHGAVMTTVAAKLVAVLRITTGVLFLWAFFDKLFGLGYATAANNSWPKGGSPTGNFLSRVHVGPFAETFRGWAGSAVLDWLFMIGLFGIGMAALLGVGLRIAAVTGTVMMALMWAATWPLARFTDTGAPTRSNDPIVDYHVMYALVLIVLAAVYAGNTWGLGRRWANLNIVRRNKWLL